METLFSVRRTAMRFAISMMLLSAAPVVAALTATQVGDSLEQSSPRIPDDPVFEVGEELTYNVSYASIDIGQVRIKLVDRVVKNDSTLYKATAYIDSYGGIPFVDLHAVYESTFDRGLFSAGFHARVRDDDRWQAFYYSFNYPRRLLVIDRGIWKSGVVSHSDTLTMDTLSQDGLSLFFLARYHARTRRQLNVMTVVNEKKGSTYIDFLNERSGEKIDAVDYPVDVVHFRGEAGFVGVFGLTGAFEGWFSNDEARVPILAKMKVLIGNVRIELMKWTRRQWTPPRSAHGDER